MDFGEVIGNRRYLLHGVGTSNFQNELELIVGRRTEQSAHHRATALLVPEPKNPYDPNAVGIEIEKYLVGYLDRQKAEAYLAAFGSRSPTPSVCQAVIVGGWHRDGDEDAYFGVRLDADMPFRLVHPPTFMRGLIFGDPRQGFASQLKQFVTALVAITGIIVVMLAPMVITYNPPMLAGASTNPPTSAAAVLSSALANTPLQRLPTMAEIQAVQDAKTERERAAQAAKIEQGRIESVRCALDLGCTGEKSNITVHGGLHTPCRKIGKEQF